MKSRLLRTLLFLSAFGWAVSAIAIFLPWPTAVSALQGLGAGNIPSDPMLDYWLRMAAGAFTGVGIFFAILAARPRKFAAAIPIAGVLMVGEGIVLLVHGLRLGLPPFPFSCDTAFCILLGGGILLLGGTAGGREEASGQSVKTNR